MVRSVMCTVCKIEKNVSEFWKRSTRGKTGYQHKCKECFREYYQKNKERRNQYVRGWSARNKEKIRDNRRKNIFKITPEEFNSRIEAQEGKCLICYSVFSTIKKPVIDHNHSNNKIRGILCNSCNYSLGIFQDSIPRLQRAILYLENEGMVRI